MQYVSEQHYNALTSCLEQRQDMIQRHKAELLGATLLQAKIDLQRVHKEERKPLDLAIENLTTNQ